MSAEVPDFFGFDYVGRSMVEYAGEDISIFNQNEMIKKYTFNDTI